MTISPILHTDDGPDKPGGPSEPIPPVRAVHELAHRAIHALVGNQPQFQKAMRQATDGHLDHEAHGQTALRADQAAADARNQAQFVRTLRDPARRRRLALIIGAVLVASLLGADTPLLNWAAEAFDQSPTGTLIITGLLFAGTVAAALYFEAANRRRRAVVGVVAVGYMALFLLRTDYLVAVGGLGLLGALLQAALLTALSAGLLAASTTVLRRTITPEIYRVEKAARQADRHAGHAHETRHAAAAQCERHISALTAWVHADAGDLPSGVSLSDWHNHLERAVAARVGHPRPPTTRS